MADEALDDLRAALIPLREVVAAWVVGHDEAENVYAVLPAHRRETIGRRPDEDFFDGLVQWLAFAPPAMRHQRREVLMNVIAAVDAVLAGNTPRLDGVDLALLQAGSEMLRTMSTSSKDELTHFFRVRASGGKGHATIKATGRGRPVSVKFVADENGPN